MEDIFIKILNMSITASYFVIALVIIRAVFRKIPKWLSCVMWGLVGLRLILPFSFESILSLIPSAETIPSDIALSKNPQISSGVPVLNNIVNPVISESFTPDPSYSVNPLQVVIFVLSVLWLTGIAVMLVYTLVSYGILRRKTRESIRTADGTYICDVIEAPFILGIIKPKIYIPSSVTEADRIHIIAHENAHIKRFDHLWKPLGFLLLSVYWFNPLMWIAYIFLSRDIEAACDERVLKNGGAQIKKSYSEALINCSVPKRIVTACPLAFGETGVKSRIKNVLSYKKPTLWIIIFAIVLSIILSVCFMTNPTDARINDIPSYADIFRDVEKLQFFTGENRIYTTEDPTFELRHLKKIKIVPEPLELYPGFYYKIEINDRYEIHIDINFEFIRLTDKSYQSTDIETDIASVSFENRIAPSAVYRIKEHGKFRQFFLDASNEIIFNSSTEIYTENTEYPGIYITLDSIETNKNGTVFFNTVWHNTTDEIATYGEFLRVEFNDGTEMIDITPENSQYNAISYILNPRTEISHIFSVSELDISAYGSYRISTSFSVGNTGPYITACGFSLTQSHIGNDISGETIIVNDKQLTIDDVIRLSEKGYDLTWSDFDGFSYVQPTSPDENDIIRTFKIDDKFSVTIIGNPTKKPDSVFLNGPGIGLSRELRNDGIEEWIREHEKDPAIISLDCGVQNLAVDSTGENYNTFVDYGCYQIPNYDRLQYLPVIKIESKEELQGFKDYFNNNFRLGKAFRDEISSFNEMCDRYTAEDSANKDFLVSHTLFLIYCTTSSPDNLLSLGYANVSEGLLSMCINEILCEDADEGLTGRMLIVSAPKKALSDVSRAEAFKYGRYPYVDSGAKTLKSTYTFIESAEYNMKPYFNLYDDSTFTFFFHPLSSYIGEGTYTIDGFKLVLTTTDGQAYKFIDDGYGNYKFDAESPAENLYLADLSQNSVFYRTK